jgi:ferric-dicitrate binding protein FerR (iron transport regulator)
MNHDDKLKLGERIAYLIYGHVTDTLTPDERQELDDWVTDSDENLALFEKLTDEDNIEIAVQQYLRAENTKPAAWQMVQQKIRSDKNRPSRLPWLIAASVLLAVAAFFVLKPAGKTPANTVAKKTTPADLPPGKNEAVLSLADGRTIILDSAAKGLIAREGAVDINGNTAGELLYTGTETSMRYNTVSTPRGGQFKLVLGDGTKVWLNAESSLKFPAGFNGNQRIVDLKGEAYFEVAKDRSHPFIVRVTSPGGNENTIEVLGTHFNVNAYGDDNDAIKTTLLEGLVSIKSSGDSTLLHPGEESIAKVNAALATRHPSDAAAAIAWTEGKFLFRDASITSIGEQIKRWYDIDVQYEGKITQLFNTEVSRTVPLSKLLDGLQGTGQVHFQLTDRGLTIKP